MMEQIIRTFPDDKPITSICIVENPTRKPPGFTLISRTHDSDSEADMWRGSTLFGNRISRYLCLSKSEGIDNHILEDIAIIGEKDLPPDGYGLIPKTMDTDAKAWKKRQIIYKLSRRNVAVSAVTDIIFLSKSKKAPEGFNLAGDINGLAVCFKIIHDIGHQNNNPNLQHALGYSLKPKEGSSECSNGIYPDVCSSNSGDYVNLLRPKRPAPLPPISPSLQPPSLPPAPLPPISPSLQPPSLPPAPLPKFPPSAATYATLKVHEGLEGVPFIFHPTLELISSTPVAIGTIPVVRKKTLEQLDREYFYDFGLERESG